MNENKKDLSNDEDIKDLLKNHIKIIEKLIKSIDEAEVSRKIYSTKGGKSPWSLYKIFKPNWINFYKKK